VRKRQQILQERAKVIADAREIRSGFDSSEGEPNSDQLGKFNELMERVGQLDAELRQVEQVEQFDRIAGQQGNLEGRQSDPMPHHGQESRYSIVKALREASHGRLSGLELETSQALAQRSGQTPSEGGFSVFVPLDLPMPGARSRPGRAESRAVDLTSAAGAISDVTGNSVIDFLRNRLLVMRLGATVLSGLNGNLLLPKQTAISNAGWVAAQAAVPESNPTIGQVALSPKRVGTFTEYDKALLHQTGVDVEGFVWNDLTIAVATKVDQTALNGSGSGNEPEGIFGQVPAGNVVALGTNGAAPTWDAIVQCEGRVDTSNALDGSLHYVTTPKGRAALKTTRKDTGSGLMVWNDQTNEVNSYPAHATNQMPSNLTKGTGTNLSGLIFGDFNSVLVGLWGGLELVVNPFSKDTQALVRVTIHQFADVQLRHAESFSAIKDMIAA
jgi:HK97 family phage major capsid protein